MNPAQRTVGSWILAAFLERGCGPAAAPPPAPVRRERPLTSAELRAFRGPSARIHFLPRRRPAIGDRAATDGAPARLLAFPAP